MIARSVKEVALLLAGIPVLAAAPSAAAPDLPANQQPKLVTPPTDARVFRKIVRAQGDDGVHTYRIPGLATSTKGTLLAVFDIRHNSTGDLLIGPEAKFLFVELAGTGDIVGRYVVVHG